jgi:phenylacetate-coenzyme A ligase PaaK-like adenylate-forming protein
VAPNVIYEGCDVELEGGILLLTSFARRYFPALRFATNDIICGFQEIIVNGRRVFGFERIAGRFGGEIKYGERISHYDICAAVADVFGNALFEVVNDGSLEVRIVADRIDQRDAEKFINRLMAACPDVRQMLASGLIAPIQITSINATQLSPSRGKRLFNLRKGA